MNFYQHKWQALVHDGAKEEFVTHGIPSYLIELNYQPPTIIINIYKHN